MPFLDNYTTFAGTLDGESVEIESNISRVRFFKGLNAVKTADKAVWIEGNLIYTITLSNNCGESFNLPRFVDQLDTTKATLVEGTVRVNGVNVPYTYNNGLLSVNLDTLADGGSVEIMFVVSMVE